MKYISTRGQAPALSFEDVMLTGLATDGGLYVPESLPQFSNADMQKMAMQRYEELAFTVMYPFVADDIDANQFKKIVTDSYATFRHRAVTPLVQLDHNLWSLELFHGPTLAFKDVALQMLGRLLNHVLQKRQQRVVVLGATSGDTGSAAIEGCRHSEFVDIFILYPHQRVSAVQRRQMTTVGANNVHAMAIEGNFDDCQSLLKAAFAQQTDAKQRFLPPDRSLVAVNSINWARIMAQIVYYFYAACALGAPKRPVSFSVPTGNFGDIFAGYLAKQMGLPVERLVVATNANDILHRCLTANDHSKKALIHSLSPSMDIMVSSNFERLLFDLYQRDGALVVNLMQQFKSGAMPLNDTALAKARQTFSSYRVDDEQTVAVIKNLMQDSTYLADPHTAIGIEAARQVLDLRATPAVCLSTAHPAKFGAAIQQTGLGEPPLPPHMQDLMQRPEIFTVIPNNIDAVKNFIQTSLKSNQ